MEKKTSLIGKAFRFAAKDVALPALKAAGGFVARHLTFVAGVGVVAAGAAWGAAAFFPASLAGAILMLHAAQARLDLEDVQKKLTGVDLLVATGFLLTGVLSGIAGIGVYKDSETLSEVTRQMTDESIAKMSQGSEAETRTRDYCSWTEGWKKECSTANVSARVLERKGACFTVKIEDFEGTHEKKFCAPTPPAYEDATMIKGKGMEPSGK